MNFLKIVIGILLLVISACTSTEIVVTPLPTEATQEIDLAATEAYQATVDTERTAIARFTENPTLALSSTPFYGIILYNEVVRQHTQTPTLDPIQPTPECWLVADFWQLRDFETNINDTLSRNGIEAHVESFVSVVWGTETCGEYLPVSNRIRIWVDSPAYNDEIQMGDTIAGIIIIVQTLLETTDDISQDPSNILLQVCLNAQEDEPLCVVTTWDVVLSTSDLSGMELILALGGLKTYD